MNFPVTEIEIVILAIGAMIGGIVLLVRGGSWVVDGAVFVAKKFGISPMVIGFTIVAFGTSLPELIVSVLANMQNLPGIALGNVIGSNIANILMVVGITAIYMTLQTQTKGVKRDLIVMLASTALLVLFLMLGDVGRLAGLAMIVVLILYVIYQYRLTIKGELEPEEIEEGEFSSTAVAIGLFILGLIMVAGGAEFLVRGAKLSAGIIGVPEAVIALSIIAFGTSLPELTTCLIAAKRGHGDIVFGNVIGSNVFNILMIIGVTALVKPIPEGSYASQILEFDIWIMALVSIIFAALIFITGKITKVLGIGFVAAYVVYNVYIYAIYVTG